MNDLRDTVTRKLSQAELAALMAQPDEPCAAPSRWLTTSPGVFDLLGGGRGGQGGHLIDADLDNVIPLPVMRPVPATAKGHGRISHAPCRPATAADVVAMSGSAAPAHVQRDLASQQLHPADPAAEMWHRPHAGHTVRTAPQARNAYAEAFGRTDAQRAGTEPLDAALPAVWLILFGAPAFVGALGLLVTFLPYAWAHRIAAWLWCAGSVCQ